MPSSSDVLSSSDDVDVSIDLTTPPAEPATVVAPAFTQKEKDNTVRERTFSKTSYYADFGVRSKDVNGYIGYLFLVTG
jgi:hypothetical protein